MKIQFGPLGLLTEAPVPIYVDMRVVIKGHIGSGPFGCAPESCQVIVLVCLSLIPWDFWASAR